MNDRRSIGSDVMTGTVFLIVALAFGGSSLLTLQTGSASRMGPGYFPVMLAGALALIGLVTIVTGWRHRLPETSLPIPMRGVFFLFLSLAILVVTIRGLGLPASLFVSVCVASFASRRSRLATAIPLAGGIAIFCALVFVVGLNIPIPLVGSWLMPQV